MLVSRVPELIACLDLTAACRAMGEAAVASIRAQMLSGYDTPIHQTGALYNDVRCAISGTTVTIGNTLPHAAPVHDGTLHMPARPYLADGIRLGAEAIRLAAAKELL